MRTTKLTPNFNWRQWRSTDSDVIRMSPTLTRRMLFEMMVIHEFEHALLRLQGDDCVWGPVHTSVGQEAGAVAAIEALGMADKITGFHRAHHHFLAKVMNYFISDGWDPLADKLPDNVRDVARRTLAEIRGLPTATAEGVAALCTCGTSKLG